MSIQAWASVCILALGILLFPARGEAADIRIDIWEGATLADTVYVQPDASESIDVTAATSRVCIYTVPESGLPANLGALEVNHSGGARTSDLEIALLNRAGNLPLPQSDQPLSSGLYDWEGITFTNGLEEWVVFTGEIAGNLTGGIGVKKVIRLGMGGQLAAPITATLSGSTAIEYVIVGHSTTLGTITATGGDIDFVEASEEGISIAGSIRADNGFIYSVEAEGSISISSSTGIRAKSGIGRVRAESIAAKITANHGGSGSIASIETFGGGFTGELSASNIKPLLGPGDVEVIPALFYIDGDLNADVLISNAVDVDVEVIGSIPPRTDTPAAGYVGMYNFGAKSVKKFIVVGDAVFRMYESATSPLSPVAVNGEVIIGGSLDGNLRITSTSSTSRWTRLVVGGWLAAGITYHSDEPLPEFVIGKGFTGVVYTANATGSDYGALFTLGSDFVINQNVLETGGEHPVGEMGGWLSVNVLSSPVHEPSPSKVPRERDVIALSGFADVVTGHRSSRPRDPGAGFGTTHFRNTLVPPETDYAIGAVAVGGAPYSLHSSDCDPRPVPGPASPPDPDNRPFTPLYYEMTTDTPPVRLDVEEPLESQFGRMDASVPERKVVLRFSGPVRAAPELDFSPLRLQYVYFVEGSPNFTTIPESHYAVGLKAPSEAGLSREVTIIAESGIGMAPGLYRAVLNPSQTSHSIVCDQRDGSGSEISVAPFEYYFYIQADCGYDGNYEPAGTQCPCAYQTLCVRADFNQNGGVDGADVEALFDAWELGEPEADINLDGGVDGADIEVFLCWWEAGGCPS